MTTVRAQQGDTIDSLCWRHLGSSALLESALELNPGLAALGAVLPNGQPVTLPDAASIQPVKTIIQLWD